MTVYVKFVVLFTAVDTIVAVPGAKMLALGFPLSTGTLFTVIAEPAAVAIGVMVALCMPARRCSYIVSCHL